MQHDEAGSVGQHVSFRLCLHHKRQRTVAPACDPRLVDQPTGRTGACSTVGNAERIRLFIDLEVIENGRIGSPVLVPYEK
ncbi:hypothetical protein [Mesorhizobium sp.]|uniref:hypothetical protein n=1 Tax=Mesorhizobium sp. TaxID=1871066 RepID=UPI0025C4FB53|nr:hypothetical protein [Mesorhizobium sp.]